MSPIALLAVASLLVAGCMEAPPEDPRPSLADMTRCPAALANVGIHGCSRLQPQALLEPAVPSGWSCLADASLDGGPGRRASLWSDGQGRFGLWMDWTAFPEPVRVQGRVRLDAGGHSETVHLAGGTGFVRFAGTFGDAGSLKSWSWGLAADGTPEHLSTRSLSVQQMEHEGAVYVWDFTAPDGARHRFAPLQIQAGAEPSVVPTGREMAGRDFHVTGRVHAGLHVEATYSVGLLPSVPGDTCPT